MSKNQRIKCQKSKNKLQKVVFFVMCLLSFDHCYAALAPSGKHDNKTPIEVTSDKLEVLQNQNKAIFTGNVVVVQGDVRMKAEKMTVYYNKKEEKAKSDKPKKSASDTGAIQKIDADGNVFLSTQDETASGATGTYDVEHHEIHLNNDVILTRGKNVLKGDHLVYNFDTGKSVLTSDAGPKSGEKSKERVRALFVPDKNDKVKP